VRRITGTSFTTIDNFLKSGKLPKARKTREGNSVRWQIPLSDLISSGLLVQRFIETRRIELETGEFVVEIESQGQPILPENESKQQIIARLIASVESEKLERKQLEGAILKQQYDWWYR
jgi:hypothetical protein